jgi:hypothetical protein
VVLELLEGLEGLQPRVAVVEPDDIADVHPVLVQVVEETAAVGARVERPTDGVLDQARLHAARRQLPQLLEAEAVGLRVAVGVERVLLDELLADAAAAALGEHGDARAHLGTRREVGTGFARLLYADITDLHTRDRAVLVEERMGGGEAREHIDAERLGARREQRREESE